MFDIQMLIGRFHPLIVHLPIGFVLIALILKSFEIFKDQSTYRNAFLLVLRLSILATLAACVTGYILSLSGNYPDRDINFHMYGGIALLVILSSWYYLEQYADHISWRKACFGVTGVLLMLTGHWGGDLTHGKGYLLQGLPSHWQSWLGGSSGGSSLDFEIDQIDSAQVYVDIVQPILEARCYSCHNGQKQKSDLRLDSPEFIQQGGESGKSLLTGDKASSQLYKALTMPLEDDLHMPPKGKTQLSSFQIEAIGNWVASGGDFQAMVKDVSPNKDIYKWYDDEMSDQKLFANSLIPASKVKAADPKVIAELRDKGLLIQVVGDNSAYLEVSLLNAREISVSELQTLLTIKENIIWLELPQCKLTAEHLALFNQLTALTKLNMSNAQLDNTTLEGLKDLKNLQIVNLTGLEIQDLNLSVLKSWTQLKRLFLFQSNLSVDDIQRLSNEYPEVEMDTGGYLIPLLPTDSLIYKFEQKK